MRWLTMRLGKGGLHALNVTFVCFFYQDDVLQPPIRLNYFNFHQLKASVSCKHGLLS